MARGEARNDHFSSNVTHTGPFRLPFFVVLIAVFAQGHADAQSRVGFMYADGRGVAQDEGEAVRWWRKAAVQGYANAQEILRERAHHGDRPAPSEGRVFVEPSGGDAGSSARHPAAVIE